ncbi:antibiotic biosynthesis monooxygenase [Porticoccus sp. W117]|uniref:antibiotic biosynthesis monooxygenase family protein n=1 Tax=Porticoccus sp. W117 TaxID=3054777 RepID=UPI0025937870|nr:antibiotic biosynthesis monooxygenase [Porticoccus sp. W117]MDM3871477.1 antibiotic biosynthesis monooxygenase [Porticoccus sp. W117]
MNKQVMNLYSFKLAKGTSDEQFIQASQKAEGFLKEQPGFLYRSVSRENDSDVWIDTGYWESAEHYQKVHQAFMEAPQCQQFMALIDEGSLQARHTEIETTSCSG